MKLRQGALVALVIAGRLIFPADALAGQHGQERNRSLFDQRAGRARGRSELTDGAPFAIRAHDPQEHVDWRGNWHDAPDDVRVRAAGLWQLQLEPRQGHAQRRRARRTHRRRRRREPAAPAISKPPRNRPNDSHSAREGGLGTGSLLGGREAVRTRDWRGGGRADQSRGRGAARRRPSAEPRRAALVGGAALELPLEWSPRYRTAVQSVAQNV